MNEAIVGNFTKNFIREMLDQDNDTVPTEKDWQDGLARVKRRIETGTDLFADMNYKRENNLALWKAQHKKEEQTTELFMNYKFSQAIPLLKELADEDNVRALYMMIIINTVLKLSISNYKEKFQNKHIPKILLKTLTMFLRNMN